MEKVYSIAENKGILPRGVIWANEYDTKRSQMLIHLMQNHPTLNLIVTRCDAIHIPISYGQHGGLQPDIVICDVPCSGDGTMRKSKNIRKNWNLLYSYEKHITQKEILENGINICKKNGYIVYSTCAINPIENEAVIASVMEKYKGIVEIVDVQNKIKSFGIKHREGLVKWRVYLDNEQRNLYAEEYNQVKKIYDDEKNKGKSIKNKLPISESMFHNIYTKENFNELLIGKESLSDPLNLRKCNRIYSHDNDTGSFFIVVLKKIQQIDLNDRKYRIYLRLPLKESSFENEKNEIHANEENKEKEIETKVTIEDDLIDFCSKVGIVNEDIEKIKKKKELIRERKQKSFNQNENYMNDDEKENENNSLNIFSKYVGVNEMINSQNEFLNEPHNGKVEKITDDVYELTDKADEDDDEFIENDDKKENKILKIKENLKKLIEVYGLKPNLTTNLFCIKESYKRIFLFSEKLQILIKFLISNNFNIMVAGLPVFVESRFRLFNEICSYRINFQGTILLYESISLSRRLNLNDSIYLIGKKEVIDLFLIKLIHENEIKYSSLDLDLQLEIKSKQSYYGSVVLIANQIVLPVICGKSNIKLMVPDNILCLLRKYFK